jgi:phosphoserine phosphatase RsbU/P
VRREKGVVKRTVAEGELSPRRREVADVAVPAFADAAAIFVLERLLADGGSPSRGTRSPAVVRRRANRLVGQPAAVTGNVLRPGEVLVLGGSSPSFRTMTSGRPFLFDHLDA